MNNSVFRYMFLKSYKYLAILMIAAVVSCSSDDIKHEYPKDPSVVRKSRAGRFFDDIVLYDGNKNQSKSALISLDQNNNNPLWIASFEVISALLPIAIADGNSGIIVSEWYQDKDNKQERVKINVLVKGKKIEKENLIVSIFRQKQNKKGDWQDQQSSNNDLTAKLIKDKILNKAQN